MTSPTPRYLAAFDRVVGLEGGYVNDPADRGGATKYGVSLRFLVGEGTIDANRDGFADYDLDMDGDIDAADIRALTPGHARALYQRCFWDRLGCDTVAPPLGEAMFDQAVNGGLTAAKKLLQRALNRTLGAALVDDGDLGPATRAALAKAWARPDGVRLLLAAYRVVTADRYRAIVAADPSQARFLKGWLRRAATLGDGRG